MKQIPSHPSSKQFLHQVQNTVTEWLKAGMVLRWVPHTELGRNEEDGRGLFLNSTEITDVAMAMAISELCGKGKPFRCVERGGFGYVKMR